MWMEMVEVTVSQTWVGKYWMMKGTSLLKMTPEKNM